MYWNEPTQFRTLNRNPNLTYTRRRRYRGLNVVRGRGPLITQYLDRIIETLNRAFCDSSDIVVYRFELRFPHWINIDDFNEISSDLMTRFWASVTSQVKSRTSGSNRIGYSFPYSKLRNVWCKELARESWTPHYHAALILDADLFDNLRLSLYEGVLEEILKEAWARVIGVSVIESPDALWIPKNNIYRISREDSNSYAAVFHRLSYLAKSSTKLYNDGSQWFGATRC